MGTDEYTECEHGVPTSGDCVECLKRAHAGEIRTLNEENESLTKELEGERRVADLHRNLNQRVAGALGLLGARTAPARPELGEHLPSWHDMPERVEALIRERDEARANFARVKERYRALDAQRPTLPPKRDPRDVLAAIGDFVREPMECGHHAECWHEETSTCAMCAYTGGAPAVVGGEAAPWTEESG